ncbi:MAG: transcriptional regulator [Gordonia sp.]|nr:transcriptional regulator [Gordonia sp. (in: high G+C Gram-positive bacteria)]
MKDTASQSCRVREVLDLVANKWALYVVSLLGEGPRRFSDLKRGVEGISQRMLTVNLRGLERDGIITRTAYDEMPPRVEYELTDLGRGLLCATAPLIQWSKEHLADIDQARLTFEHSTRDAAHLTAAAPARPTSTHHGV